MALSAKNLQSQPSENEYIPYSLDFFSKIIYPFSYIFEEMLYLFSYIFGQKHILEMAHWRYS